MEKTIGDIAQRLTDEEADERDLQVFEQTLGLGHGQETSSFEGQFAVVNERDLAYHTQHGSRLVRVLDRTVMHEQWVEKERDHPHGVTYGRQHYREKEMQWGPGQVFLIFTPMPAAALKKRLEEAEERATAAQQEAWRATQKVQELERNAAELSGEHARALQREQQLRVDKQREALQAVDHARKMEADIAKLRKALGEIEMKRILTETA